MVLHACHADCVFMVKQMLDFQQVKNKGEEMKYFNALIATVMGTEEQRAAALEYLKEVDPETWDQEE